MASTPGLSLYKKAHEVLPDPDGHQRPDRLCPVRRLDRDQVVAARGGAEREVELVQPVSNCRHGEHAQLRAQPVQKLRRDRAPLLLCSSGARNGRT